MVWSRFISSRSEEAQKHRWQELQSSTFYFQLLLKVFSVRFTVETRIKNFIDIVICCDLQVLINLLTRDIVIRHFAAIASDKLDNCFRTFVKANEAVKKFFLSLQFSSLHACNFIASL